MQTQMSIMNLPVKYVTVFLFLATLLLATLPVSSTELQIHYINVGQGGSTLIVGPNGTTILYDFGKPSRSKDLVEYLSKRAGISPGLGLDYAIVSHRHVDHYGGYKRVVDAGYDVKIANYAPLLSIGKASLKRYWSSASLTTKAGRVQKIPVGLRIALGDGAEAIVMAADGRVYGDPLTPYIYNENDRSIAVFVRYRNFHYLIDGDLGGGPEACSNHETAQRDVQTRVAKALLDKRFMNDKLGVDVLHIAHHGSESSTTAAYFKRMKAEVGLISVGLKQGNFHHPHVDVVEGVLLGNSRADCPGKEAPPLKALFQTEDGAEKEILGGKISFAGSAIGDIVLTTDGLREYRIEGNNRVAGGKKEALGKPWVFRVDEAEN